MRQFVVDLALVLTSLRTRVSNDTGGFGGGILVPTFRSKTIPSWNNERVDRFAVCCGCVGVIASRTRRREGAKDCLSSPVTLRALRELPRETSSACLGTLISREECEKNAGPELLLRKVGCVEEHLSAGERLNLPLLNNSEKKECEEPDSNRRTPTRLGPEPSAFDLAWQPSRLIS